MYDELETQKDDIEEKLGLKLEWHRLDDKKASKIIHKIPGLNIDLMYSQE